MMEMGERAESGPGSTAEKDTGGKKETRHNEKRHKG